MNDCDIAEIERLIEQEKTFENYIDEARSEFVIKVKTQKWNTKMRTAAEDILIAYDQMVGLLIKGR